MTIEEQQLKRIADALEKLNTKFDSFLQKKHKPDIPLRDNLNEIPLIGSAGEFKTSNK